MKSRYDFMKESAALDTDNEPWPDPLSVSYNNVKFSEIPTTHRLSSGDIEKFWLFMYKTYGVQEYDDILLNLNGIPYIGMQQPGDIIFKIKLQDLINFNDSKLPGMEED